MKSIDVAIVGGGLAGLIAACATARMGFATLLLEAAPHFGGRAHTRNTEGFHFNQGPHALYADGQLNEALRSLAGMVSGHRIRLSNAIALWGDQRHPLALDNEKIRCATPFDDRDKSELLKTFAQIASRSYDFAGQPLTAFTARLRPRVAKLIEALIRLVTYSHAPHLIDGNAALDQLKLSLGGVLYVDGGWGELVAGLAAAATVAGADLRTRSPVVKVERQQESWVLSGPGIEDYRASSVVLAVTPQVAAKIAQQSRDIAAAVQKTRPVKLMCLDLGLSKLPCSEATFALGIDQPVYFSVHSTVARLAPSDGAMVHIARYLAPNEPPRGAYFECLERLTDHLQPGWRTLEVQRQRFAGMVVAHDLPGFQTRGQRAPVIVHDAPGLFLAGDWIGAEGMLSDASAASARAAARAVQAYSKEL